MASAVTRMAIVQFLTPTKRASRTSPETLVVLISESHQNYLCNGCEVDVQLNAALW